MLLFITSALLAIGAAFDGKSTVDFLTKSKGTMVEEDSIMIRLYGSDTPSPTRVWVTGTLCIGAEVGIAFLTSHLWHPIMWAFVVQQLIQAGYHLRCYVNNEAVLSSYLKSVQK